MKIWEARKECYRKVFDVMVRGYLDPEEQAWQYLCIDYRLLGIKVWSTVVFKEHIPSGCYYSYVCTGVTSWISKRPDLVDEWNIDRGGHRPHPRGRSQHSIQQRRHLRGAAHRAGRRTGRSQQHLTQPRT